MTSSRKLARDRTEEEIAKLVNFVRETDCQNAFAELRSYVSHYISVFEKKYRIPGCDADEIEQECLFALRYKAIEDFNPERGKFKSFAILCIKRHLFSLIKGNNQHKRIVLNTAMSLNEDRSDGGDNLSLINLIADETSVQAELEKKEIFNLRIRELSSRLSKLEQEVFKLYIKQYHYDEIVDALKDMFPKKCINKKVIDNALVRARKKAQDMIKNTDLF